MATIIAAMTLDGGIGYKGNLLVDDPIDMYQFRLQTTNQVVIMGRNTYESLPNGFLPNRVNLIVTSCKELHKKYPDQTFTSLTKALYYAGTIPEKETFIIGGGQLYKEAITLPHAHKLILTEHYTYPDNSDTFFPPIPKNFKLTKSIPYYLADEDNGCGIHAKINFYTRRYNV
jgi:dihydrofolate reductase